MTLYGGACFAWKPDAQVRARNDTTGEKLRQMIDRQMRSWRIVFRTPIKRRSTRIADPR